MKKILTIAFLALMIKANAQTDLFNKLKNQLKIEHPEISLENKLIALNIWNSGDQSSREANKQFNKAYTVYEFAKLQGGKKGIVCISINKLSESATVILNKDGITKLITVTTIFTNELPSLNNIVFDEQGNEIYKNIATDKIFESINKLVTR